MSSGLAVCIVDHMRRHGGGRLIARALAERMGEDVTIEEAAEAVVKAIRPSWLAQDILGRWALGARRKLTGRHL